MRKPRDYDAELEALDQRARALRQRKTMQHGELVSACGADSMPIEMLAGALLAAAASNSEAERAAWARAGEAMFRAKVDHGAARKAGDDSARSATHVSADESAGGTKREA